MFGETGETPVRARRRETVLNGAFSAGAASRDKVIGAFREGRMLCCQVEISGIEGIFQRTAGAGSWKQQIILKGEKQMNMTKLQRILSFIVCIVLIAAVALFTFGCNGQNSNGGDESTVDTSVTTNGNGESTTDTSETPVQKKAFTFIVVDGDGNETSFSIQTDLETVGAALLAEHLIEGEDSAYGLYVKKVNGITADYDVNRTYWAFYINGEYAMTGVDSTPVTDGATYSFKVEK